METSQDRIKSHKMSIMARCLQLLRRSFKRYGYWWLILCVVLALLYLRFNRDLLEYITEKKLHSHPRQSVDPNWKNDDSRQQNQTVIDYIGHYLNIEYSHDNMAYEGHNFSVKLKLKNNGLLPITSKDKWSIFFHLIRLVEPTGKIADGYILEHSGFRLKHILGNLFVLSPVDGLFTPLLPGKMMVVELKVNLWQTSRFDVMPNWYVSSPGLQPRYLESTKGESLSFVEAFDSPKKWKRDKYDLFDPYTAEVRYDINKDVKLDSNIAPIFPTPLKMNYFNNTKMAIDGSSWVIVDSEMFSNYVSALSQKLKLRKQKEQPKNKFIVLKKAKLDFARNMSPLIQSEAYTLEISDRTQTIELTSQDMAGMFHGIQSLLRLVTLTDTEDTIVPTISIQDAPRYSYRGLHLDVGRNFKPKQDVLKLLDAMSLMKLNKFHLHLSEDEGWRLEIPGLPELTKVASKRCHDMTETVCLMPQLGSGPVGDTAVNGFYTVDDYKEILNHAAQLFIEVIPEFDMPGHSRAAIKAMEQRSRNVPEHMRDKYLLSEKDDLSKYISVQYYNDNAVNPCIQSTYVFIKHLVREVKLMHENIQRLKTFHFGGDEVPKGAWIKSPACKKLMSEQKMNSSSNLMEYFVRKVVDIVAAEGLNLGAWEDGLSNKNTPYTRSGLNVSDIYAYAWKNVWQYGHAEQAYKLANHGYKVVMAQATHLYFDHPYEPDPEERGYVWATRYISTRKLFGFMPERLYENADISLFGYPIAESEICSKPPCIQLKQPKNIIGMQAAIWGEAIRSPDHMFYMAFPRLFALAERSWHKATWEDEEKGDAKKRNILSDWTKFANRLGQRELLQLDKLGVKYRIPLPGARNIDGRLHVNTALPGLFIEMSTDQGMSWQSAFGKPTVEKNETILLRTRSADKKRFSRTVEFKNGG